MKPSEAKQIRRIAEDIFARVAVEKDVYGNPLTALQHRYLANAAIDAAEVFAEAWAVATALPEEEP